MNTSGYRFCSASGSHCFYESAAGAYRCQPCGGRGELCCPVAADATSPNNSGVCNGGLTCAFAAGGYRCN
jgi:hypothetical protein